MALECVALNSPDKLTARGQLIATRQALEIAGAKNERRLFPVACTRLLGPALAPGGLGIRFLTPFLPGASEPN